MLLNFTATQIDALMPAFLHIDRHLNISAMGSGISRHMPEIRIGMPCAEVFSILNSEIVPFFKNGRGVKPVRIISRSGEVSLSGAAIFHEDGCLLAIRFVLSDDVFSTGPFDLSDFGDSDPVVLSTMLIALQRAMLEEAQATALELAHERQRSADLLARISSVAGYMAHDFNNLLSIIRLNADRLSRQFGQDERIKKLASIIFETASRGSHATQSLMTLSQQRNGTLQPISIDDVIKENAALLNSVVGSTVTIFVCLEADSYKSVVDYNELLNGIINLLINAREAMPHGGHIDLSTSVGCGPIGRDKDLPASGQGEYIAICIADNGLGMSDTVLSRAFEPQFSAKPNGTGLGLASVRNFALEIGGDVWLESAMGKGTTVHLHLPAARQSPSLLPAKFDAATGNRLDENGTQRILLVEDEPYALEALSEMLEAEGYAVTPCKSGEEALVALERETYDILLSDIVMPGQNGTEVARQATAAQPAIKVILMSGYVPDYASLQPGWMFMHKPMDRAELLHLISG